MGLIEKIWEFADRPPNSSGRFSDFARNFKIGHYRLETGNYRLTSGRAFSILEAMIGVAVFAGLAAGTLALVLGPITASSDARERGRAVFLAEEGIEASRSIRNDRWTLLAEGDHGLIKGVKWGFAGASDETEGFSRTVTVSPVNRDTGGDIVTSGGNPDSRTRQVMSRITWTSLFGLSRSVEMGAYLTDWNAYDWKQTTDADFGAGSHAQTEVTGSGEAASVELAPSTQPKVWIPSEGKLNTHSSEEFWRAGEFTDTQVQGVGLDATVTGMGELQWIEIYAGKTFFQTTDAHFITGSFSQTVAVDTGDLGAVALDTRPSWAPQVSGVNDHLYDVSCVTATDCSAVGAGGRILRWDGTTWTTVTSPTASALNDIDMISATDGFAVGAGGAVIRWNGTSWSALTALNQTANGVFMLSSTDGWAVGNSGKFWRWNGTAWSQFVDTGNQGWSAVWMNSATDGWAVGGGSDVRRWNGTTWAAATDPTIKAYNGVSCGVANLCFAVGASGTIIRWNGTAWATVTSPTASALSDVFMISPTDGWAIGASGTVLRWNGTAWSSVTSPDATAMNGVFQVSSDEAYAVGQGGVIWQFASHYYTSGTYLSRVFDAGAVAAWGHTFWNESLPDNTDLTIAFRSGNTPTPDGTWSAWSGELTNPYFSVITPPAARYLQYRATLTSSTQLSTPRLNSLSIYYNEPATDSFYDVKVTSLTDGWAVGGGNLARFNGIEWLHYPSSPTTDTLLDVDFADANNVWAVGDNGRIIRWNGTSWAVQTSGTARTLFGVDVVSTSFAFAVGANGTILRWNGTAWSSVASPINKKLQAISCSSATDCWAVGDNGSVIRWNGAAWSEFTVLPISPLNGIFVWDADTGYIVGGGGKIFHWNGTAWGLVVSTTPNELRDVHCALENDCWAWGIEQTFLHWDGAAWSRYVFTNPSNPLVQGGQMLSLSDGWAVGEGGAIYHYTAVYPSPAYWTSPVIDGGAHGTHWNTMSWDSLEPLGTGMQIVTRTCDATDPASCVWSGWSAPLSDKGGSIVTSPDGQYLQYMVIFTTTMFYNSPTLVEVRIVDSAATGQALYDCDGIAVGDVWAVGRSGTSVHYDGTSWSTVAMSTNKNLNGVDQVAANDAYAVGAAGTFVRWNGTVWSNLTSPTGQDMTALSMVSSTFGAAVGTNGAIAHWNGTSWATVTSPTTDHLRGVHLFSATLGFAVGDSGRIVRWNGTAWSNMTSPTGNRLNAVHLTSATLGFAVGNGGVIAQWNGTAWSTVTSPVVAALNAVEARSATEAWAGGNFGIIIQWDGASWQSFVSPTTRNIYGITVEAPTDGWMCGDHGSLLKDPGPYYPLGTFISSILDADAPAYFDTAYWAANAPLGTGVTVAFRSGDTPTPDASWSAWSADYSNGAGVAVPSPSARYFQYRATLNTTDVMASPAFQEIIVTYHK